MLSTNTELVLAIPPHRILEKLLSGLLLIGEPSVVFETAEKPKDFLGNIKKIQGMRRDSNLRSSDPQSRS